MRAHCPPNRRKVERAMGAESERVKGLGSSRTGCARRATGTSGAPLSERQWGTVREDYSRRRRGLDILPPRPRPVKGVPLGRRRPRRFLRRRAAAVPGVGALERPGLDLERRAYGLTGAEANHGEDAKDYWWYLDALPSHAWNRWRYHYPQARFSLRGPAPGEQPAQGRRTRSTNCSTPAPSTKTVTGWSRSTTRRPTPTIS